METAEDIQFTLVELGEKLTFTGFTIYGILEVDRVFLQRDQAFSQFETQEFNWLVSTADYKIYSIAAGTTFTTTDNTYTYTFTVAKQPFSSMDGWCRVPVNLTNRV